MINILWDFLSDRKEKVVLNSHCLPWTNICVDEPEFTIFGALFSKHTPITHQMVLKKTTKKQKQITC